MAGKQDQMLEQARRVPYHPPGDQSRTPRDRSHQRGGLRHPEEARRAEETRSYLTLKSDRMVEKYERISARR